MLDVCDKYENEYNIVMVVYHILRRFIKNIPEKKMPLLYIMIHITL